MGRRRSNTCGWAVPGCPLVSRVVRWCCWCGVLGRGVALRPGANHPPATALLQERRVRHSPASLVALMGALGYAGPPELAAELLQRAYAPAASGAEAGGSSSSAPADAAAAGVAAAELQQEEVEEKRQVQQQPQEQQQQQQKQQQTDGESREQPLFGQHSLEPGALAPDARAFSAGIGACCRQGRMEEALGLLRLMRVRCWSGCLCLQGQCSARYCLCCCCCRRCCASCR